MVGRPRHAVAIAALPTAVGGVLPAHGQAPDVPPVTWPAIVVHAATAQGVVPAGWRLEHEASGRLDDWPRPDLLLLLRMNDPNCVVEHDGLGTSPFDTNPRMRVIALAEHHGGDRRALVDHALISRPTSPVIAAVLQDDPANALRIRRNGAD